MLKIVHLSTTDSGGAIELHAAMLEIGIHSSMLVKGHDVGGVPNIYRVSDYHRYRSNFGSYLSKLALPQHNDELSMFSIPFLGVGIDKNPKVLEADVIYLHFVAQSSFLSLFELESLLKLNKPVVFITRDIWPMTGGCHCFLDCKGYLSNCKACPHYLSRRGLINWSKWQLEKKEKIFRKYPNLIFVGISEWCRDELMKSFATKSRKSFAIGNAIDTDLFTISDKKKSKEKLGLPVNVPVIGFGARSVSSTIKGFGYLKTALKKLKNEGVENFAIATFGSSNIDALSSNHFHFGFINERKAMAEFYNAIDVYVSPTLAEAFGNTVAESMACGTPVVGFNTGGLKDIVDHNLNGYLAEYKNSDDLANGIKYMIDLTSKKAEEISSDCRNKIIQNFCRNVIAYKHLELLKSEFGL